jgi:MATE family multidrug resistance protein
MKLIDKNILQLAVPSIVSNITVPLLGLVDLTIVGHLGAEQYIAAIAVGTMAFNVMYWLFGFLRMGTSGMTAQALGRGDGNLVRLLRRRSLVVGVGIALVLLLFQWPLRWLIVMLIHPSAQVVPLVNTYFYIVIWGAPAMLGLYSLNGWFIGMQNTRIPMLVAIVQNLVNIIVSLALVFGLGLRIEGVAIGTLVAQWSGFALALWLRRSIVVPPAISAEKPAVTWSAFFTVNRDIFLRTVCLVAVNLFFTSAGARQGDMVLAVNTLLMTFFTLFSYVMDGFAFAGEALSGKAWGAGDRVTLRATVRRLLLWGVIMVLLFTLVYLLGGTRFLELLTDDRRVIAAATPYFFWACLIPVAGMAAFVYDGIFIGLTATRGMLLSSVAATALFFLVFLGGSRLFTAHATFPPNHFLWLAFILYLAMRGLMQHVILVNILNRDG